jgi:hypothetical protein
MEASRLYKYQCLAVNDYQLRPLALVFKKLPADSRRVRCLFLTQACWISQFYQRGDSGETDKNRLLKMVALTLETLEICCYLYRFPLPFQLPVLVDLTIHGTYDYNVPMTEIPVCYPALRHLRLDFFLRPLPSIYPINIDSCDLCGGSRFVCNPIILVIRYREYGHLVVTEDKVKNQKINS